MHVFCTRGYLLHTFTPPFTVNQFHTVHLPWNEMRPRAAFLPRRFSAMHSYVPASSCWKLGISRTAFEFFILTLLGKGMPLVLLQLISGTGLRKRRTKSSHGGELSVAAIKVWLSTERTAVEAGAVWVIVPPQIKLWLLRFFEAFKRTLISAPLSFYAAAPCSLMDW